jgi:hypothetical protein
LDSAATVYIPLTVCCELNSLSKVIIEKLIVAYKRVAINILVFGSSLCILEPPLINILSQTSSVNPPVMICPFYTW